MRSDLFKFSYWNNRWIDKKYISSYKLASRNISHFLQGMQTDLSSSWRTSNSLHLDKKRLLESQYPTFQNRNDSRFEYFPVTLIKICDNNDYTSSWGKCSQCFWQMHLSTMESTSPKWLFPPLHPDSRFLFVSHIRPPSSPTNPPLPLSAQLWPSFSLFLSFSLSRPHGNYYKSESQSIFNPRGMVLAVGSKRANGAEAGMGPELMGKGLIELEEGKWMATRGCWSLQQCQ